MYHDMTNIAQTMLTKICLSQEISIDSNYFLAQQTNNFFQGSLHLPFVVSCYICHRWITGLNFSKKAIICMRGTHIFLCLSISSCAFLSFESLFVSSSEYRFLLWTLLPNRSKLGDLLLEYLHLLLGDLLLDLDLLLLSFS